MNNGELKRNCKIIMIGTFVYDVFIVAILSLFVIINKLPLVLYIGFFVGSMWNVICVFHITYVLERSVDTYDEHRAKIFATAQSIGRKIIFIILVIIIAAVFGSYTGLVMIGTAFGLRFGTFLYPLLDKIIK